MFNKVSIINVREKYGKQHDRENMDESVKEGNGRRENGGITEGPERKREREKTDDCME